MNRTLYPHAAAPPAFAPPAFAPPLHDAFGNLGLHDSLPLAAPSIFMPSDQAAPATPLRNATYLSNIEDVLHAHDMMQVAPAVADFTAQLNTEPNLALRRAIAYRAAIAAATEAGASGARYLEPAYALAGNDQAKLHEIAQIGAGIPGPRQTIYQQILTMMHPVPEAIPVLPTVPSRLPSTALGPAALPAEMVTGDQHIRAAQTAHRNATNDSQRFEALISLARAHSRIKNMQGQIDATQLAFVLAGDDPEKKYRCHLAASRIIHLSTALQHAQYAIRYAGEDRYKRLEALLQAAYLPSEAKQTYQKSAVTLAGTDPRLLCRFKKFPWMVSMHGDSRQVQILQQLTNAAAGRTVSYS